MKNTVYNLTELPQIVSQILATPQLKKVLIFKAEMGAGKTTLIKEIVKQLGVSENTASPTFGYVNEYKTESNETIYHFDLYRLEDEETAYQLGIDEYFYSGEWCLIEWPEKTPNLIPLDHAQIHIEIIDETTRKLSLYN